MAGHSKWKNIKHKKANEDAKKAKRFTKLLKEITIAARLGDIAVNPHLRHLIEKAHEINMPKENYLRAIKRGTGELEGGHYDEHRYEAYGPSGVAIIIDVLSDNKNRAASEIRATLNHNGGHIAEPNAVMWMFEQRGIIQVGIGCASEEDLADMLQTYDIREITMLGDGTASIVCDTKDLQDVIASLKSHGGIIDEAHVGYTPKMTVEVTDEHEKVVSLLHALEELDDVQNVYVNIA